MPMLSEDLCVTVQAEAIAAVTGAALQNCEDPAFSVTGFSTDTRSIAKGNCFLALKGSNFNGNLYAKQAAEKGASLCILSEQPQEDPGVPYLVVPDTVRAYGQLANFCLQERKRSGLRVFGVTGSSGKTTVKDMTAHVLAAKYRTYATSGNHNNHIGVPYTLLHMPANAEIAVIEMGMNHAGEINYLSHIAKPDAAIITNIGTAHIGNLGSQEHILSAKLEILNGMHGGTLLVPADDPFLHGVQADVGDKVTVCFSSRLGDPAAELQADCIEEAPESTRFSIRFQNMKAEALLPMTGLHNVSDALLAVHAGLTAGMALEECAAALADFVPGAMRSERVQIGNITVIRDYYNANPEAMQASLAALGTIANGAKKIAVLGNMNELGEFAKDRHRALGALCREKTDAAFFCGENHNDFAEGYGENTASFQTQDDLIAALLHAVTGFGNAPLCILIKGSRGMHMERVNHALEQMLRKDDQIVKGMQR